MELEDILSFTNFLTKFREVERQLKFSHHPRPENDAEHSWQLAMVAWYIISSKKLDFSMEKIFKYCIVHDIVEIYAGDVDAMFRSPEIEAQKAAKEKEALILLKKNFPHGDSLWQALEDYEHRTDPESRFIYALDKLLPVFNIFNDGGYWRKEKNVELEKDVRPAKEKKIKDNSPEIGALWDELYVILQSEESKYFG